MKKILGAGLAAGMALSGCASESNEQKMERIGGDALEHVTEEYGCVNDGEMTFEVRPQEEMYNPVQQGYIAARVEDDNIIFSDENIEESSSKYHETTMTHEILHWCGGDYVPLEEPFFVSEQYGYITGTEGLTGKWGVEGEFDLLEEGYATLLTRNLVEGTEELTGDEAESANYASYANLLELILEERNISIDELVEYHHNSDLFGFINRVYGRDDNHTLTSDEVLDFMIAFRDA